LIQATRPIKHRT